MRLEKRNKKYLNMIFILVGVWSGIVFPQENDRVIKLRLAQGFAEGGEWERSAALYEELYKSDPLNYTFLNGLQQSYTQLKEYDKAITIIRRWFVTHPRDITLMTTLGGLYYDSGRETTADSVWNSIVAADPRNLQTYRLVANEMMQHRLYDQCIRTYLGGRAMMNSETLFADELGTLYAALQQYPSAAKEYLRLIKKSPDQLAFVQSRLSAIIIKPEALQAIAETVNAAVSASQENIALHRLSVWLLLEERKYTEALEHYRSIDHLANAHGNELYNFAQQLNQEHASAAAAQAFKEIIDMYSTTKLLPNARFGYTRALEDLSTRADSLTPDSQPEFLEALQLYESIASSRDRPDLAAQALYRIGMMKYEYLFDLDGALLALNKIDELPNTAAIQYTAALTRGDVEIARNDLNNARKEFERTAKLPIVLYQNQAVFKLAELDYFEAQFDTSLFLLKRFTRDLGTDLTNDALELQYFIQENVTSSLPALKEFAQADLQMRQRKFSESLNHFRDIVKHYPSALLIDDALMKIGELYLKLKQPAEAIAAFQFISDSIQTSILKDRAQFRIAEISDITLRNRPKAIEAYEKLLERYPNSLYAEESRKRIRMLRGDNF
jgi:tetratricopeptide (TPR) repeat protein